MWSENKVDESTNTVRSNGIKANNVVIRDCHGQEVGNPYTNAVSVEILFESHKGDRIAQGTTLRHYKSKDTTLCPVNAAIHCLVSRSQSIAAGEKLGCFLTSVSSKSTITKRSIANFIKKAAINLRLEPKLYSTHSLRIGGACALLAAGQSELVIKLLGRWSSWCFSVYTRLRPGMLRTMAEDMISASSWSDSLHVEEPGGGTYPTSNQRSNLNLFPHNNGCMQRWKAKVSSTGMAVQETGFSSSRANGHSRIGGRPPTVQSRNQERKKNKRALVSL
jgi:hypothetical protein